MRSSKDLQRWARECS